MIAKNKKLIILICSVFLGGMVSGLIFQLFVFPLILSSSYFSQFQFVKNFKDGKVIINTKEEIVVQENSALEKSIEKVEKSIVGVKSQTGGSVLSGSGLIITADGLIATLAELAPVGASVKVFLDGEEITSQVVKRDQKNNLVLLKIEKTNLSTCAFSDFDKLKLGKRVFLLGVLPPLLKEKVANEGIIKTFSEDAIKTNIFESNSMRGSSLFNIEAELIGLNAIDSSGKVISIPASKIKSLAGF
jgi:S1-C subfamily serine protease